MLQIIKYDESYRDDWEYLVDSSFNGTFMHKRAFLDYHGDKFKDVSVLVKKNDRIVGAFPAAEIKGFEGEQSFIVSHPGLTFGGLVYNDQLRGQDIVETLLQLKSYYHNQPIVYKATPSEFHRLPVKDDIWALFKVNAEPNGKELSSIVNPFTSNYSYWPERKLELSSIKDNIVISALPLHDINSVTEFWTEVVEPNLAKYNTKPVHTAEEMVYLYNKFPMFIKGIVARHTSGKYLGGLIIFRLNKCYHVQYSVTTSKGRALKALTLLHHYMLENLPVDIQSYNFGKSTEDKGHTLNESLYYYKNGFGGGSLTYDTFMLY